MTGALAAVCAGALMVTSVVLTGLASGTTAIAIAAAVAGIATFAMIDTFNVGTGQHAQSRIRASRADDRPESTHHELMGRPANPQRTSSAR